MSVSLNKIEVAGNLLTNKNGEYTDKHYGKMHYAGWYIKVNDENGYLMTNLQLRTDNPVIATKITQAKGGLAEIKGAIRTINIAKSTLIDGKWVQGKPDYRTFLFVDSVEQLEAPADESAEPVI